MTDTDTEARRLAEQVIVSCEDADDIVSPEYLVARHLLALLERMRLTEVEIATVIYERIKHGDEKHQEWLRTESQNVAYEIISRLTTQPEPSGGWQDIASAPKGRKILLYYTQSNGVGRTITGQYYLPGTLEWSDESPEYCEGDGFAPEGWYEESETHEDIRPTEYAPTHWMPLPSAPLPNSGGGE